MKLSYLLQAYNIDELMSVINDMFPGTGKFSAEFSQAYDILVNMTPVPTKKTIVYKVMDGSKPEESYIGAEDSCFNATWEVCLGKDVVRQRGADLNDAELAANCLVNLCLLGKYPASFEKAHQQLMKG